MGGDYVIRKEFFTQNVAISAFFGVVIGACFVGFLSSGWSENAIKFGTYGLTILATLFASGIALSGVLLSLSMKQVEADAALKRSLEASKSMLPLALSQMIDVCRSGVYISLHSIPPHDELLTGRNPLSLDNEVLKILREVIEFADECDSRAIFELLATYQILVARSKEPTNAVDGEFRMASKAVDWAHLHILVSRCFSYSRRMIAHIETNNQPESVVAIWFTIFDLHELTQSEKLRDKVLQHSKSVDAIDQYSVLSRF